MYGIVCVDWILYWMKYYYYFMEGSVYFFFYNLGGFVNFDRLVFNEFINVGFLSIIDILDFNFSWDYLIWYFY